MRIPDQKRGGVVFVAVGVIWLLVAVGVGWSGQLESLPKIALQGMLISLTAGLLAAYFFIGTFRLWVDGFQTRQLIALHLCRFVGVYFLFLYSQNRLPRAFAVYGGWGDILVAAGALVLLLLPRPLSHHSIAAAVWNTFGLLDILLVVAAAATAGLREPASMIELTHLPLSLLVTLIVPVIIASHIVIYVQLARARSRPQAA